MVLLDLILVILLALLFSSLLGWGIGWRHPARSESVILSVTFLFVIFFFALLVSSVWWPVTGMVWYGHTWVGILLVGMSLALLVLALSHPTRPPVTPAEARAEAEDEKQAGTVFNVFFWILMVLLIAMVVISFIE